MARDGIFPKFFKKVSKKSRVPFISIITISGITLIFTLALDLTQIANLASSIFLLLFAIVSLSGFILRKKIKANFIIPLVGFILATGLFGIFTWNLIRSVISEVGAGIYNQSFITIILLPLLIIVMSIGSVITIKAQLKKVEN